MSRTPHHVPPVKRKCRDLALDWFRQGGLAVRVLPASMMSPKGERLRMSLSRN